MELGCFVCAVITEYCGSRDVLLYLWSVYFAQEPHFNSTQTYLWTHHHFNVHYNGDRIISANVTTKDHSPTNLDLLEAGGGGNSGGRDVRFTYSVQWITTTMNEEDRDRILQSGQWNMNLFIGEGKGNETNENGRKERVTRQEGRQEGKKEDRKERRKNRRKKKEEG